MAAQKQKKSPREVFYEELARLKQKALSATSASEQMRVIQEMAGAEKRFYEEMRKAAPPKPEEILRRLQEREPLGVTLTKLARARQPNEMKPVSFVTASPPPKAAPAPPSTDWVPHLVLNLFERVVELETALAQLLAQPPAEPPKKKKGSGKPN